MAWRMLTRGEGTLVDDPAAAVEKGYTAGADHKEVTDEFVLPLVRKGPDGKARAIIKDGDACFFYNFRADRARQLTRRPRRRRRFPFFDRGKRPELAGFATMTQYDSKVDLPVAFPPQSLKMILGEVLSKHGVSQLRTAETEKYPHVTFFFNGGNEEPFPGEERKLVPSNRDVATYDLAPEMSAAPVTDGVVEALKPGRTTFMLVNFANPDMVGHTGMLEPAIHAVDTIDTASAASSRARRSTRPSSHRRSRQLRDDARRKRAPAHRAHDQSRAVHRLRGSARGHACSRAAACGRRADGAGVDGDRRAAGDGRREPLRPRRARRQMSIGKRLIDLARSELNSLLDKAARVDGDDADERERRRYGSEYGSMSDKELDEEIERRRQAREEVEQADQPKLPARARSHRHARRRRRRGARPPATRRSAGPTPRWRCRPGRIWRRSSVRTGGSMRKYHPDLNAGSSEKQRAATDLSQRLTEAYKTLERHLRR